MRFGPVRGLTLRSMRLRGGCSVRLKKRRGLARRLGMRCSADSGTEPFPSDAVDVGCVQVRVSVDSQVAIALVVGQEYDYVWSFTGHFCASGQDIYGQPICLVRVARPEVFRIVHAGRLRRVRRQCPVGFVLFDQGQDIAMGDSIF